MQRKFFRLLITYSLWLRLEIIPPVPFFESSITNHHQMSGAPPLQLRGCYFYNFGALVSALRPSPEFFIFLFFLLCVCSVGLSLSVYFFLHLFGKVYSLISFFIPLSMSLLSLCLSFSISLSVCLSVSPFPISQPVFVGIISSEV